MMSHVMTIIKLKLFEEETQELFTFTCIPQDTSGRMCPRQGKALTMCCNFVAVIIIILCICIIVYVSVGV